MTRRARRVLFSPSFLFLRSSSSYSGRGRGGRNFPTFSSSFFREKGRLVERRRQFSIREKERGNAIFFSPFFLVGTLFLGRREEGCRRRCGGRREKKKRILFLFSAGPAGFFFHPLSGGESQPSQGVRSGAAREGGSDVRKIEWRRRGN